MIKKYAILSENNFIEHLVDIKNEDVEDNTEKIVQLFFPNKKIINVKNFSGEPYKNGFFNGEKFISPKPFNSWILDNNEFWIAPISYPEDGNVYIWNENNISWEKIY